MLRCRLFECNLVNDADGIKSYIDTWVLPFKRWQIKADTVVEEHMQVGVVLFSMSKPFSRGSI